MDLTEAEDIKKRWQEYTEELYKKGLHDPDNHNGIITHLEPDILECVVPLLPWQRPDSLPDILDFSTLYLPKKTAQFRLKLKKVRKTTRPFR